MESNEPGSEHYRLMAAIGLAWEQVQDTMRPVLKNFGLKPLHYHLMSGLYNRGSDRPMATRQLANLLHVHPTTATLQIEKLEKRKLVTRSAHETDARTVLVSITPKGEKKILEIHKQLGATHFGLGEIAPKQAERITEMLLPIVTTDTERLLKTLRKSLVEKGKSV